MTLAKPNVISFSASAFYDDDLDLLAGIAREAGMEEEPAYKLQRRVRKACRTLARCGILSTRMQGTQKDCLGEPARQQDYWLSNPSYAWRLRPDLYPHYNPDATPDWELNWLLNRAYGYKSGEK